MSTKKSDSQRLKILVIKRIIRMEKRQREFFERIEAQKGMDAYLTVDEIQKEFGVSRSTFNRYRIKGLKVLQNGYKGKITVRKGDFVEFLKNRRSW
ncbi:helix-turn-helix domain-containing protein [Gramella sp. GC03-9]|uniref:Helix-turn-helix domain-containing protein n=1 Tax=Christiangramia oceanisediminis TaxID=2920386 RepID=A0A9X2IAK8_9FLAO|nr:helix-turn-helix domain-containing protein [Gramella oceanisediminis]MCP9199128.1 helix-turn-helix domain-containing protein [Gramella oceanisediminis]